MSKCIISTTNNEDAEEIHEWTESKHTVTFKFRDSYQARQFQRPESFDKVLDMLKLAQSSASVEARHAVTTTQYYIAKFKS